jgi:ATP synthase protein I
VAQEPDDAFQARLASAQAQRDKEKGITAHSNAVGLPSGMGLGFRIGIELVVGLAVGGGVGYLIDRWLGSTPWLTIVFFFLGAGAGVMNVYRTVNGLGSRIGYQTPRDGKE